MMRKMRSPHVWLLSPLRSSAVRRRMPVELSILGNGRPNDVITAGGRVLMQAVGPMVISWHPRSTCVRKLRHVVKI